MIFLIGNKGLLGTDVEIYLRSHKIPSIFSDKEIDITNYEALKTFCSNKQIDWIINCSGYTNIDTAESEQDLCYKINYEGVKNLTEIAKDKNAKIIHISDAYVFDGEKIEEYDENDSPNPKTIYGKSKLEGEKIIRSYDKSYILRTSWLYGKFGNSFVSSIIKLISKKSKIQIVDDQVGSPTYTKDLVEGIFRIIDLNSTKFGIYNFSNKYKTDWFEFAKEIYRLTMLYEVLPRYLQAFVELEPITTSEYKTSAPRLKNSYLCSRKFEVDFEFSIKTWKQALDSFISILKTVK